MMLCVTDYVIENFEILCILERIKYKGFVITT